MGARTWAGGVLTVVLAVPAGAATPAGAAPPAGAGPGVLPAHTAPARVVTLITGDRVSVTGAERVGVARGPGRDKVGFITRWTGGHLHVVPSDAAALVRSGRLDPRLFDVTALLSYGYDRLGEIPLIVAHGPDRVAGATVTRDLPAVDAVAVRVPRASAASSWRALADGGGKVWLDALRRPALDTSVRQIGAPDAWAAGHTGAGVTVAVLDTGVDATHPDLAGRVAARRNFTDGPLGEDERDLVGHGTHVASTIAGGGNASGGRYAGVATGARLLDGKVCVVVGCAESWILAGMQWAAEQGARVVNMSLSAPDTPGLDPVEQAVNDLSARHGTLFVVAAGNSGDAAPVGSPATADAALAVGAVTDADDLAYFSARGPRLGDDGIKPDITAPGVDITAARSRDGRFGVPGEPYVTASGTSMAAPHVAGAAAILAGAHPDWSGPTLKAALMASAEPRDGTGVFAQGAGRVDIARGVRQHVTTEPASLGYGRQAWPHDDDVPIDRTVTYHNGGPTPVTLTLVVSHDGPPGTFTVSPARLTVPPGASASTTVTADTRTGAPNGLLGGRLVATADGVVVQTPLAVHKEIATYALTLAHTDRDGRPIPSTDTFVSNLDSQATHYLPSPESTHTVRLPEGRYVAWSVQIRGSTDDPELTTLVQPELILDRDRAIAFDGRRAGPVSVTVPRPAARSLNSEIVWSAKKHPGLWYGGSVGLPTFERLFSGPAGPDGASSGFVSKLGSTWGDPVPDTGYDDIPAVFVLAWFREGRMHAGFHRSVAWRDLATIRAVHHRHVAGGMAQKNMWSFLPGKQDFSSAVDLMFHLPFTRTEYVNNDGGHVRWSTEMVDDAAVLQSGLVNYRTGCTYGERWNSAVYAPALADRRQPGQWVGRGGDTLSVLVPFYGDGAGRPGFGVTNTARTTLFHNGVKLYDEPDLYPHEFALPAAVGTYRLELEATRGGPFTLSTYVKAAWVFRSAHVAGATPKPLPLMAIRFAPELGTANTAPAGRRYSVPVAVQRQAGAGGGRVRTPTVEVSYDDGATWLRAPVRRASGGGWVADLVHPDAAGFVSLRARAADDAGNTVEQTVIHAYETTGGLQSRPPLVSAETRWAR